MLTLLAEDRKEVGKKVKIMREEGFLPAVLYGGEIKEPLLLKLEKKEFEKIYKEAGTSSLIFLEIKGEKHLVLIKEVQKHPLSSLPLHVDFYQPLLEEEVEVTVPIVFEGEAEAVKELGGTLVKNISEVEVKALPQKLPHQIKVNVSRLKTFEDHILIKDLEVPNEGVKILKDPEEIVAFVSPLEKVEEELKKPIEEKVKEAGKVEEKKEENK